MPGRLLPVPGQPSDVGGPGAMHNSDAPSIQDTNPDPAMQSLMNCIRSGVRHACRSFSQSSALLSNDGNDRDISIRDISEDQWMQSLVLLASEALTASGFDSSSMETPKWFVTVNSSLRPSSAYRDNVARLDALRCQLALRGEATSKETGSTEGLNTVIIASEAQRTHGGWSVPSARPIGEVIVRTSPQPGPFTRSADEGGEGENV